jgi:hypothetical protein
MNEYCEREKFELQEQIIDMEGQLQIIRNERDQFMNRLIDTEYELKKESVGISLVNSKTKEFSFQYRIVDNN